MAVSAVITLLALLIHRAQADNNFTLWDALQSNGYVQHNAKNFQINVSLGIQSPSEVRQLYKMDEGPAHPKTSALEGTPRSCVA
jgi:hypothetical protein